MKKAKPVTNTVKDCQFYGIKWDAQSIESVKIVAQALQTNAEALKNLTTVFTSQNINVECLLKIDDGSRRPQIVDSPKTDWEKYLAKQVKPKKK